MGGYPASRCRALLRPGGRHIMVSGNGDFAQALVPPFTSKNLLGRTSSARMRSLLEAVAAGALRVAIAARFPLAEAEKAHALSRAGHTAGKILLLPEQRLEVVPS